MHLLPACAGAGRILFAADEEGGVRAYKLPLSEEHQAQRCGLGPAVARIAVTHDESLLFAATRDGCVWVYDVRDRVRERVWDTYWCLLAVCLGCWPCREVLCRSFFPYLF